MHHQIYGFPPKKIQDQQISGEYFVMLSSAANIFSAEILRKIIESAEVLHKTKSCVVEFRSAEK